MKRRGFFNLTLRAGIGAVIGATLCVAAASAAPLAPLAAKAPSTAQQDIRPAVTSREEAIQAAPQQVRWGHHWHRHHWHRHHWHHRHWHHRHWGWHHHHRWHHRHGGWHHHHGHRHHW